MGRKKEKARAGQESYREYCAVGEYFVPITSLEQKESIELLLGKTASTSC